ncbi:MAG: hypothetical protein WCD18_00865 [Thermosynechococcaceae cyanobacterium]
MRELIISFSTAFGGTIVISILWQLGLFYPDANYVSSSIFASAYNWALINLSMFLIYLFIVYCLASVFWVFSTISHDFRPGFLTLCAGVGMAIGEVLDSFLGVLLSGLGAWLSFRVQKSFPVNRGKRLKNLILPGVGWIVVLFLISPILTPKHGFPGADQPLQIRHRWAEAKFGKDYQQAVALLQNCQAIQPIVGNITGIAPTKGRNYSMSGPGETVGSFTLEVQGDRGKGIAEIRFMRPYKRPLELSEGDNRFSYETQGQGRSHLELSDENCSARNR